MYGGPLGGCFWARFGQQAANCPVQTPCTAEIHVAIYATLCGGQCPSLVTHLLHIFPNGISPLKVLSYRKWQNGTHGQVCRHAV